MLNCQTFLLRRLARLEKPDWGADDRASRDDVVEAVTIHEELASTTRRVYGEFHPFAKLIQHELMDAQEKLAAFDASHRV